VASFPHLTEPVPCTFVSVYRRNNDARRGPHRIVGTRFVIPSIYSCKRIRDRFRENMENSSETIRGYADIFAVYTARRRRVSGVDYFRDDDDVERAIRQRRRQIDRKEEDTSRHVTSRDT